MLQPDNDDTTLNNITTIVDMIRVRLFKYWYYIEWIFSVSELGKKYYTAVNFEHGKSINKIGTKKRIIETADKRGLNDEKP